MIFQETLFGRLEILKAPGDRIGKPHPPGFKIVHKKLVIELVAVAHDHQTFDHIFQLPHVARPVKINQRFKGIIRESGYFFPGLAAKKLEKMVRVAKQSEQKKGAERKSRSTPSKTLY